MTKPQPLTKREPLVSWLHAGAPPIVYRTPKAVDGGDAGTAGGAAGQRPYY